MLYYTRQVATALTMAAAAISLGAGCSRTPRSTTRPTEMVTVDTSAAAKAVADSARLLSEGKDDAAREVLEKAVKSSPNYGPLHNNLGIVHYRQGRLYEAAREFDQAVRLMPTLAEPRNNLGMVLEKVGRYDDAIASYTKAHDLQADNAVYLGNLLRARVRRGDSDASMRPLFEELLLKDTRPDWQRWARDQMTALDLRTITARPTTTPAP